MRNKVRVVLAVAGCFSICPASALGGNESSTMGAMLETDPSGGATSSDVAADNDIDPDIKLALDALKAEQPEIYGHMSYAEILREQSALSHVGSNDGGGSASASSDRRDAGVRAEDDRQESKVDDTPAPPGPRCGECKSSLIWGTPRFASGVRFTDTSINYFN